MFLCKFFWIALNESVSITNPIQILWELRIPPINIIIKLSPGPRQTDRPTQVHHSWILLFAASILQPLHKDPVPIRHFCNPECRFICACVQVSRPCNALCRPMVAGQHLLRLATRKPRSEHTTNSESALQLPAGVNATFAPL